MKKSLELQGIAYNIRSAHNVGSLLRTADAGGIKKLFLCGITPAPIDRFNRVVKQIEKVSLGAEKTVAWESIKGTTVQTTIALLKRIKKENTLIVAVEQNKQSIPLTDLPAWIRKKRAKKIALLVGNEVLGIPQSLLKKSDVIVEIPMHGKKESLNVAVAFGIAIFKARE